MDYLHLLERVDIVKKYLFNNIPFLHHICKILILYKFLEMLIRTIYLFRGHHHIWGCNCTPDKQYLRTDGHLHHRHSSQNTSHFPSNNLWYNISPLYCVPLFKWRRCHLYYPRLEGQSMFCSCFNADSEYDRCADITSHIVFSVLDPHAYLYSLF